MSIQGEFLEYLRSQFPERLALSSHLGGDGRICCYYICSFSTLRKIAIEGIKCRNSLPKSVDLSSPDVQSRRNTVWLGRSDAAGRLHNLRDVPIHSCVNLFWNPLNRTFDAFQRNGLLRAAEISELEHGIICLLELDADRLLNEATAYWTATSRNVASNAFASFNMSHLRQFSWAETYALGDYTQQHPWQLRAAELIVFLGETGQRYTTPIPRSCITRILLSTELHLSEEQQEWLSNAGFSCHRVDVFKPPSSLLKSEGLFFWNLTNYCQADKDGASRLAAAFRIVISFESRFGGPSSDRFVSPRMAHGPHGIGHVSRVMFWSAFLATYPFGEDCTNHHTAAVLAALLHDLGRRNEWEDLKHGERALEKNQKLINEVLEENALRESCVRAVQRHGIIDSECPVEYRDWLWELLKDADALDRGRFGRPDNNGHGCNPSMLRLGYLCNTPAARQHIPWLAYQLHGITKHSQWDKKPCRRMLTDFFYGLSLGLTHNIFRGSIRTVAQSLHQKLFSLLEELEMQDLYEEMGDQYAEYDEAQKEEEQLYKEEQEQQWQEWLESDDDNDWDDHDMNWEDFDWDDA